jgi:endonuclease/exonuclease/phosphatase family metal-dependent hydrolase
MRRWLKLLLILIPLAALAWLALWLFPLSHPRGDTTLTLLSWNVHGLQRDGGGSIEDLVILGVGGAGADILAFQEFPVARTGERVRRRLRALGYSHEALFVYDHSRTESSSQGMAVYSRFPIVSRAEVPLAPVMEGRLLGTVELEVEGRALRLGVVHFPNSDIHMVGKRASLAGELTGENERTVQARALLGVLRPWRDGALVLAGDFNTFPLSSAWRLLRGEYHDAFPVTRWHDGTFQIRPGLEVKIDHIFHTARVRGLEARVLPLAGSDHRPVFARLQF